jgi:prepilin-type N-terminal cleavage/methylation domain-containing protein
VLVSRARDESGFTLIEVLVTTALLSIVVMGGLTLSDVVVRQGRGVIERTEAAQRGRLVLDAMTQQVRSQVCLNETTKGLISATPTELSFYADFSDGSAEGQIQRRTLQYDPEARQIVQFTWFPVDAATARRRVLLDNVVPARDETLAGAPVLPFFRYWAYPTPLPASPRANVALTGNLAPAQVGRVARVGMSFSVRPPAATTDEFATPLHDDVVLRNADPNATIPDPTCR